MSIYSTVDITREGAISAIRQRIIDLETMSDHRLIEILEAMVQERDYDDRIDECWLNNFRINKNH